MKRAFLGIAVVLAVAACGGAASSAVSGGSASLAPAKPGLQGATASVPAAGSPKFSDTSTTALPAVPPVTGDGPKVIRSGRLTVEIPNGQFETRLSSLEDLMASYGGYSSGSDAATDSGVLRSGTITFQVPAVHFQEALDAARKLGKVQAYVVTSQDVSSQYVDLQGRLANEEAVRDAILQFFKDAHNVQDDIAIENQLGQVTAQIEQLKGQIDYLDHATAYSTITVALREAAAAAANTGDSFGFARALSQAAHNFVYVVDGMLEMAGSLLPFLLLLVPLWFVLRYRRGLARLLPL